MKEIPILFSSDMVRAILENRKTQTRRLIKLQPHIDIQTGDWYMESFNEVVPIETWGKAVLKSCSYGKPGDVLYVRESHYRFGVWKKNGLTKTGKQKWRFMPDSGFPNFRYQDNPPFKVEKNNHRSLGWYKRSSLFMPKEFTRIWLEVTNIRVERLQDISEDDAIAEGIEQIEARESFRDYSGKLDWFGYSVNSYRSLWEKINGEESWSANPFVWVVEFSVLSTTGRPKSPDLYPSNNQVRKK